MTVIFSEKLKIPERSVSSVPAFILAGIIFFFFVQVTLSITNSKKILEGKDLPEPVGIEYARLVSLGDEVALAKMIMLWLQAFDNQPGISIPFRELDYERITGWLDLILKLDFKGQYPLLAGSRIYTQVQDEKKQRLMLDFIYQQFFKDPNNRWPSLAHATYIAKHKLNDLELALKYAEAMAEYVTAAHVPYWVKQMNIYVLEDMGEIESAKILIGGLIESGAIKDAHELSFLMKRLEKLENESDGYK